MPRELCRISDSRHVGYAVVAARTGTHPAPSPDPGALQRQGSGPIIEGRARGHRTARRPEDLAVMKAVFDGEDRQGRWYGAIRLLRRLSTGSSTPKGRVSSQYSKSRLPAVNAGSGRSPHPGAWCRWRPEPCSRDVPCQTGPVSRRRVTVSRPHRRAWSRHGRRAEQDRAHSGRKRAAWRCAQCGLDKPSGGFSTAAGTGRGLEGTLVDSLRRRGASS
jgi:hypothetical protein